MRLRFGVKGDDLHFAFFACFLHSLAGHRAIIRVEGDEARQVWIGLHRCLRVAQGNFGLDIVQQNFDQFQVGAFQRILHARDPVLGILGSGITDQPDDLARPDDFKRGFASGVPCVVVRHADVHGPLAAGCI